MVRSKKTIFNERSMAQTYLDFMQVIVVVFNVKGEITLVNRRACNVLGCRRKEIIGKNWFDVFVSKNGKIVAKRSVKNLVSGKAVMFDSFESSLFNRDKTERIIAWNEMVLKDRKGKVFSILASGIDVTEEKESKNKIKSLADFSMENPQPSLRIAANGTLLYANAASFPITATWGKRVGDKIPDNWRHLFKEVLLSGLRQNVEIECKGRVYSLAVVPVKKALYVNLYGMDITERKKSEQQLRDAYGKLKQTQGQLIQAEKMQVVGTLASGVAHEVKNPLATIMQGIDYLSTRIKKDDKKAVSVIDCIRDAVERANNTIKGILDFSSISKLKTKKENLNSVIENTLSLTKPHAGKYHIKITTNLAKNLPNVELDKNRMVQVFVNLFMNAIYAMPKGGELKVRVHKKKLTKTVKKIGYISNTFFRIGEEAVLVEIEDTGCGIPKSEITRIFDPFFTTRREKGGSGLGLPVVKNIMEMHGGMIDIKNKKKRGVKVTITLKI